MISLGEFQSNVLGRQDSLNTLAVFPDDDSQPPLNHSSENFNRSVVRSNGQNEFHNQDTLNPFARNMEGVRSTLPDLSTVGQYAAMFGLTLATTVVAGAIGMLASRAALAMIGGAIVSRGAATGLGFMAANSLRTGVCASLSRFMISNAVMAPIFTGVHRWLNVQVGLEQHFFESWDSYVVDTTFAFAMFGLLHGTMTGVGRGFQMLGVGIGPSTLRTRAIVWLTSFGAENSVLTLFGLGQQSFELGIRNQSIGTAWQIGNLGTTLAYNTAFLFGLRGGNRAIRRPVAWMGHRMLPREVRVIQETVQPRLREIQTELGQIRDGDLATASRLLGEQIHLETELLQANCELIPRGLMSEAQYHGARFRLNLLKHGHAELRISELQAQEAAGSLGPPGSSELSRLACEQMQLATDLIGNLRDLHVGEFFVQQARTREKAVYERRLSLGLDGATRSIKEGASRILRTQEGLAIEKGAFPSLEVEAANLQLILTRASVHECINSAESAMRDFELRSLMNQVSEHVRGPQQVLDDIHSPFARLAEAVFRECGWRGSTEELATQPEVVEAAREVFEVSTRAVNGFIASAQEMFGFRETESTTSETASIRRAATAAVLSLLLVGCGGNEELNRVLVDAVAFKAFGGLGVFLLGMKMMSDGLKSASGSAMRRVIETLTSNRWAALAIGAFVTATIQSSSATSVMSIGLVDAEAMTLQQAMGVIFGCNIGTTMTAWLFAFNVVKYGLPIIGASALVYNYTREGSRSSNIGEGALGLGLVFLGLTTMSDGFKDPHINEMIRDSFGQMDGTTYLGLLKCILAGAGMTALVQSSSATVGVTIALAQAGAIRYETAAGLVLGENIGTTVTAALAVLRQGTSRTARQVALSHVLFNVFGVALCFPLGPRYVGFIHDLMGQMGMDNIGAQIATTHSGFNILNALLFTALIRPFRRAVETILPPLQRAEGTEPPLSEQFPDALLRTPEIAYGRVSEGIAKMEQRVRRAFDYLRNGIEGGRTSDRDAEQGIYDIENWADGMQDYMRSYLLRVSRGASLEQGGVLWEYLRRPDQLETISDHLCNIRHRLADFYQQVEVVPDEMKASLLAIHDCVARHYDSALEMIQTNCRGSTELNVVLGRLTRLEAEIKQLQPENHENSCIGEDVEVVSRIQQQRRAATSQFWTEVLDVYIHIVGAIKNIVESVSEI
ncbi:MAG: hypothetical protein COS89_02625 [Deltaproteobacteria bacterium CG07_land_8_20_14_0_80_38_7]|nr:MAG: hypothetical protein COS89_02625 [Deltaproteobacteria bacterium CG07_land_8_20_14_0_80_38_7]